MTMRKAFAMKQMINRVTNFKKKASLKKESPYCIEVKKKLLKILLENNKHKST